MGRRYRLLLAAYLISSLGNWIYKLALPLLVLARTGSPLQTGAVYTIEYLPFLLLSLPGGVLADRFQQQRLLVAGDTAAGGVALALGLVVAEAGPLWAVYALAFVLACAEPVYHPSFQSLIPRVAPQERLAEANARLYGGDNLVNMGGPALAGALVAAAGHAATILVDAATFLVSALLIALIGRMPAVPREHGRPGAELRAAVGHVLRDGVLRTGALMFAAGNLLVWTVQANFVYYVAHYRHYGPALIGVMVALQGAGALAGASLAAPLMRRRAPGVLMVAGVAGMGASILLLIPARAVPAVGLAWTAVFACGALANVAWFTLRQRTAPPEMLGRVVAATRMAAFASVPLGTLAAGGLESWLHDMYLVMGLAGIGLLLVAAAAARTPLARGPGVSART
ncbi:MFS transporter [Actinomadura macrotermitis]|uniref:MFS transporter n=1 Tax=Actinomadura macrotermitis TaxID=2585200 RepID=UPI00129796D7|nr:MFS transporter [Actinomadura macrotermitis]